MNNRAIREDGTITDWLIIYADGAPDTLGREASEVVGMIASEAFPSEPAQALRDLAAEVLDRRQAREPIPATVNGREILTRIIPFGPDAVAFTTELLD